MANEGFDPHLDPQTCRLVSEFFSIYANHTRIRIFCALHDGRKTVSEIADYAEVTLQNASQHLRLMRDKGALTTEKEGQKVYYSVADPRFLEGVKLIRDAIIENLHKRADSVGGAIAIATSASQANEIVSASEATETQM